jgi:hypothetical protein
MTRVFLNNIPFSNVHFVENTVNTIVCNSIKEEFFGISTISLNGQDILCEQEDSNIVKINVVIENKEYKDVPFKLVIKKDAKPAVAINKNTLNNPVIVEKKIKQEIIKEAATQNEEIEIPLINVEVELIKEQLEEKDITIDSLKNEIKKLSEKRKINENQQKQVIQESIKNTIEQGVEKYKQKLLEDFFNANNEQEKIKELLIENTIRDLENIFNEKYIESVASIRDTTTDEVKNYTQTFLSNLEKTLEEQHTKDLSELQTIVETTIKSDLFLVTDELKNTIESKNDSNKVELFNRLEQYKQNVKEDILNLFENNENLLRLKIEKDFDEKLFETKKDLVENYITNLDKNNELLKSEIFEQLQAIEQKVDRKRVEQIKFDSNELIAEAIRALLEEDSRVGNRLSKFKDTLLKDIQKAAESYTKEANSRMMRYAEMMSGGGSVAVNYARGGIMSGDLNITGRYLSAGKDLYSIFSTITASGGGGGTGRDDVNTAVITNSGNWNSAYKLAVNTLPVPKIIFSRNNTTIPHLSGIGDSMVNAGNFTLWQYPRVVTQGLTQDLLNNYSIFVEMAIFKNKKKTGGNTTSGYTTPNPYPDVKPWGNYFWTRSGGNTLAAALGFDRYNQLPVTSINEVIDLSPCFHNHFRSVDVSYLDSTSVDDRDFKFLNCIVPINSRNARIDSRITRLGYDRIYKSMYVAFRYIAWLPEANGGRGQIVEGPLSPTVRVANTRWPFNTDPFNSSLKGFAVVTPNAAFNREDFNCTFV